MPAEYKKEFLQEFENWRQQNPRQVKITRDRIIEQNGGVRKRFNIPPLDPDAFEKRLKAAGIEVKEIPENIENTPKKEENHSAQKDANTQSSTQSSGPVHVRAHTREGHPIAAHERSLPAH